ncbi:MAG: class II aldolase/adducin family protein [Solobacterium sp.]|nr:class II aldolase/adducin family protein [Solobacterium sp.]
MKEDDVRRELVECGKKLADLGLIQGTWGNLSARLDQDHFLITPSGADYYAVRPEDIVKVDLRDGTYEEGKHPSSERLMHQLIYRNRPDLGGIVHTHSPYCSVFAACRKDLITSRLDYPCAPYGISGSKKLAVNVSRIMLGHDGCILSNHGFVCGAADLKTALALAAEAEKAAEEILK